MKRLLIIITPFVILIGTFLWALGTGNTILSQQTVNYGSFTWTYYKFDFYRYINNIQTSLDGFTDLKKIIINAPQLPKAPSNSWDILNQVKYIVNILLIYLTNWLIYIINLVFFTPIKIILYIPALLITLIGINANENDMLYLVTYLMKLTIPYIPNI